MSISQPSFNPNIDQPSYQSDLNAAYLHSPNASLLHLFNNFAHHISSHHYYPRFDIEEHEQSYELYGDLPGVQQASLKIETTNDHTIEISGSTLHHHGVDNTLASGDGQTEETQYEAAAQVAVSHPTSAQPNIVFLANGKPAPPISNGKRAEPLSDGGELTKTHGHNSNQSHKEKLTAAKGTKVKHLMTERQHGEFHRIFPFANSIKEKEVRAKYDNGILHVTVPKGLAPVKNRISVYWGGSMF
jgi:HSP20 family protein